MPALGIFGRPAADPPYIADLNATQQQYPSMVRSCYQSQADIIDRFRAGVKNAQILETAEAAHPVFVNNEAQVVRAMWAFLVGDKEN